MNVSSRLLLKTSRTWSATLGMSLSVTGPGQKGAKLRITTHHYAQYFSALGPFQPSHVSGVRKKLKRSLKEVDKLHIVAPALS